MMTLEGDRWRRRLDVGESLVFGRSGGGADVALADDARLHRACGELTVHADSWELVNVGRWLRLRVVGLDRPGVDQLSPGERLRVPWRRARVEVHVGDRVHGFEAVHAGRSVAFAETPEVGGDGGADATVTPIRVDRSSGYFRALVALCEPRLVDPSSSAVATDLEIARRLNRSGSEAGRVSGKTVERRLDHCRTRFGLKDTDEAGSSAGLERRDSRRILVEVALLTATVTPADLRLLDSGVLDV